MGGAAAAAAAVTRARRLVISHFMGMNAVSADSGVDFVPARRLEAKQFDRLRGEGVIKPAKSGFYIDIPAYDAWSRARRKREAFVLTLVMLVLMGVAIAGAVAVASHGEPSDTNKVLINHTYVP